MASRFPSGQDEYNQFQRSSYIYQSRPSSSSSSSSRSFPAPPHSPTTGGSYRHTAYPAPRTTTIYTSSTRGSQARQSYGTRERGSSEYYRSSNATQHNQRYREINRNPSRDSPLPYAAPPRSQKSPGRREWTPRYNDGGNDFKSSPSYPRSSEHTPRPNRPGPQDRNNSRYTQPQDPPQSRYYPQYTSPPYRGRSSPSNRQRTPNSRYRSTRGGSSYSPGNPNASNKISSRAQNSPPPVPAPSSGKKGVNSKRPTLSTNVKEQCSICLNDVTDKVSLECNHTFCYECLVKWCATKDTCPLCRTKITEVKEMKHGLPNKRMYGSFRCSCGNRWKSTYTYSGIKQGCRVCGEEVEAYRQLPRRQANMQIPNIFGLFAEIPEKNSLHRQELCGMCKLLGRDCSRPDNPLDDEDLLDMVALENLMSLFTLSDSAFDPTLIEDDVLSLTFSDNDDLGVIPFFEMPGLRSYVYDNECPNDIDPCSDYDDD